MEISDWRERIDSVDKQLIALLSERAQYGIAIGSIKKEKGLPVFDAAREESVLTGLCALNQGPLPDASIRRIFLTIMEETRAAEAALGELHT